MKYTFYTLQREMTYCSAISFINVHLHTKSLYTYLKKMKQQTPCCSSQLMLTSSQYMPTYQPASHTVFLVITQHE